MTGPAISGSVDARRGLAPRAPARRLASGRLHSVASLLFFLFAAASAQDISSPDLRIAWPEFKKLYDARSIVVADVRPLESFDEGHIPRAISLPLDDVEKRVADIKKLGKPIVLYCA